MLTISNKKELKKELFKISSKKFRSGESFTMEFKIMKGTCLDIH